MQLPIIVIDDDTMHLTLIQRLMARLHKLDIEVIQDGALGFERMNDLAISGDAAIILLDLNMPTMDGYDILRQFKGDDKYNNLYIVVFSTSDEPEDIAFALDCGVTGYLVKPTNHRLLRLKIDEITEKHQAKLQQS